jgi:hypothetical protein
MHVTSMCGPESSEAAATSRSPLFDPGLEWQAKEVISAIVIAKTCHLVADIFLRRRIFSPWT